MSALSTPGAASRSRLPGLTTQIFIGLAIGIVIGHVWPDTGVAIRPLADLFLRLIKMILAPLIFSTLVIGIAGTGDLKAVGRIGLKAIVWFELATTIALVIGLVMVNLIRPGAGVALPAGADTGSLTTMAHSQQGGWDILLHMVPTSLVDAMAKNDILQVVVFASFFGVALAAVGARGAVIVDLLDNVAHVMFKVTGYVMRFAPIGVLAAMAATVGGKGLGILTTLGALVLTMYASRFSSRSPPPAAKPHCPRRSRSWSASACRSASSASCCRPGTASTWTARRCICLSRRSSWRSSPASS